MCYFTVNTGDPDQKGHITWELNLWRTVDVQADAGMSIARPIFQHCAKCKLPEPSPIDEGWLCLSNLWHIEWFVSGWWGAGEWLVSEWLVGKWLVSGWWMGEVLLIILVLCVPTMKKHVFLIIECDLSVFPCFGPRYLSNTDQILTDLIR